MGEPREGERGGQRFDPAVEAALLRATEARPARLEFAFDAARRTLTIVAHPERLPTDVTAPPPPERLTLLWAHLKIALAAVLAHEASEHAQRDQQATGEVKQKLARHLQQEGEHEIELVRALDRRRAEARTAAGGPGDAVPGFEV